MDISCVFNVVTGNHDESIQQSAGLVGFLEQLVLDLVGDICMSHYGSCLVCHHSYPDFCQPVLLGGISGSLLERDPQLPIVALGLFLELEVLSTIVHPDKIDLVPILLPLLELFAGGFNHAAFLLEKIRKLQLCLFVHKNPTMTIIYSLDVLGFLDGIYIEIDSCLAIKLLHVFFGSCYILLFCLCNHAGGADSKSSTVQFPS
jgi:hypothetical protein